MMSEDSEGNSEVNRVMALELLRHRTHISNAMLEKSCHWCAYYAHLEGDQEFLRQVEKPMLAEILSFVSTIFENRRLVQ